MKVIPYFYFNGNAQEALERYQKAFKTKASSIMRFKDQPSPDMPPEFAERIMHTELAIGDDLIYISDAMTPIKAGGSVEVNLNCDSEEDLRYIYGILSEGANITMPLQDTFWGALFVAFTDQYGVSWSLNYQYPEK